MLTAEHTAGFRSRPIDCSRLLRTSIIIGRHRHSQYRCRPHVHMSSLPSTLCSRVEPSWRGRVRSAKMREEHIQRALNLLLKRRRCCCCGDEGSYMAPRIRLQSAEFRGRRIGRRLEMNPGDSVRAQVPKASRLTRLIQRIYIYQR